MRKFLIAGIASLAMLAACSTNPGAPSVTLQLVATDISTIATGLNTALNNPAVVAAIPGGVLPAKVSEALTDLMTVSQAAAAAPDAAAMKGSVSIVESDVNVIVGALAGLKLPPPAPTILLAATVLLPAIEVAVGIVVPASASASTSKMSPDAARVHLKSGK